MTRQVSRRSLLLAAAAVPSLAWPPELAAWWESLFGGTPTPSPTPSPDPTETPTAIPTEAPADAGGSLGSYGPDGRHWPANTPKLGSTFGTVIDVACTWASIGKAIASVTDAEIEAGVHIRVAPGTLPGFGASSGSRGVLKNLGRGTASTNILVSPKDGWGTVSIADSSRFVGVKGVTFARINARFMLLSDCSRTNWVQSKVSYGFRMTASNGVVRECNAYEVVMADAKIDIADPFGYAAGKNSMIADSVWEGCYCAPVFRPDGASDHIDSLQMYGNGAYRGLTIRDSTIFGGLNSAIQLGGPKSRDPELGTPFFTVEHSILTAQVVAASVRYPAPSGAYVPTMGQAINGSGESGQLFARDSFVFGSMYTTKWGEVANSFCSYDKAPANNPSLVGGWQYDAGLSDADAAWFDAQTPIPTDDYLRRIWA
ncbi:hypothetical protein ACFWN7_13900 [Agromyces sp. NPDC058484]|uniref:hypothetical protein n=1 Tax=Agromyces sp. NPDC058484 TaxID=3346524 RepID=UPI003663DD62